MKRLRWLVFLLVVSLSACSTNANLATPTRRATAPPPTKLPTPRPTQPITLNACVTDSTIRVRGGPGTDYGAIGGLVSGTCVTILGRNQDSDWVYIETTDELNGWVAAWLLTIEGNVNSVPVQDMAVSNTPTEANTLLDAFAPTTNANSLSELFNTPTPQFSLCAQMGSHIDSFVTCRIPRAYCVYLPGVDGSPTFCNEKPYPENTFQLVVFGEDWSDYDGQCILVSGYLENYFDGQESRLQIMGYDRLQVSYC